MPNFTSMFTEVFKYSTIPWFTVNLKRDKPYEIGEKLIKDGAEWNVLPSQVASGPMILNFLNKALATDVEFKLTISQMI
jgi:hypothetical protein